MIPPTVFIEQLGSQSTNTVALFASASFPGCEVRFENQSEHEIEITFEGGKNPFTSSGDLSVRAGKTRDREVRPDASGHYYFRIGTADASQLLRLHVDPRKSDGYDCGVRWDDGKSPEATWQLFVPATTPQALLVNTTQEVHKLLVGPAGDTDSHIAAHESEKLNPISGERSRIWIFRLESWSGHEAQDGGTRQVELIIE